MSIDVDHEEPTSVPAGMRLEHGQVVPHLHVDERVARGKAARREVPRESHAEFKPGAYRPDPVELLERQGESRVQELIPIRYGRMLVSPFTFYRGAALVMARDLAGTPRSGINVQLCGDAHLMNFGAYASAERKLIFGINDFDETLPGPWEWDVKRLAASFAIAGRNNEHPRKARRKTLLTLMATYREAMAQFAAMPNLELWYSQMDVEAELNAIADQIPPAMRKKTEANLAKSRTRDSMQAFSKMTRVVDGERRIISDPPLIVPIDELAQGDDRAFRVEWMRSILRRYRRTLQTDRRHLLEEFRFVDMARKVVGVGSVGTRCWIILMLGRDDNDPLFLQAKEAQASVLEEFVSPSRHPSPGQRVVHGQHLMQASSDIFLGWDHVTETADGIPRDYYVRQLRDWKGSAIVEGMQPLGLTMYGRLCATTLARAHARSGDRVAIASYLGNSTAFDEAVAEFSEAYADQNERDYAALEQAEKDGRIKVERGL